MKESEKKIKRKKGRKGETQTHKEQTDREKDRKGNATRKINKLIDNNKGIPEL